MVDEAYNTFLDSIYGTEDDGWQYRGEKKGVRLFKKDVQGSPFSFHRGEKILDFPQHVLFLATRDKSIRLAMSDGQMRDCGTLEVIDGNCTIQFEGI